MPLVSCGVMQRNTADDPNEIINYVKRARFQATDRVGAAYDAASVDAFVDGMINRIPNYFPAPDQEALAQWLDAVHFPYAQGLGYACESVNNWISTLQHMLRPEQVDPIQA